MRAAVKMARHIAAVVLVVVATLFGAFMALKTYTQTQELSVGRVQISVEPGHKGALDLYVPLVDWGVRFEDAIRLPVRLHVDLRTVDRGAVAKIANGGNLDLQDVRGEAREAIKAYLLNLIGIALLSALALGTLVAFAIRHRSGPRLRYKIGAAVLTTVLIGVALVTLLPPRGKISDPQYYAFGPDIPRALQAVEAAQASTKQLDQELDAQLVGLARLVTRPSERTPITNQPTITVASDLHNNFIALPILERATNGGPLFFAGDLTDRGSPLEARLVSRVVGLGKPFVFVSGNHDSDSLERDLARLGAIVLTEKGRLNADGSYGPVIQKIAGLRVAGYSDPFERRAGENFKDRYEPTPTTAMTDDFTAWLRPLIGKVDAVLVHQPALIEDALEYLETAPPPGPLLFVVGHTHVASLERQGMVDIVNGGSIGAGGTGNLADAPTELGLARLSYDDANGFEPLAVDLVEIDPGSGAATARRERLDQPPEEGEISSTTS